MDKKRLNIDPKQYQVLVPLMPGLGALIQEKRELYGAKWVAECWRMGVLEGEPGWFFARQGSVSVGTPPSVDEGLLVLAFSEAFATQVFLYMLAPKDGPHGTH
jgi:hypothetical protein